MKQPDMTPESYFHEVGTHYVVAELLFHLNKTPALTYLCDKKRTSISKLCEDLKLDLKIVTSLFDYLSNVTPLFELTDDQLSLTEFGEKYLTRFSRRTAAGELQLNFWDVRVGAYGNVWESVDRLATKEAIYGQNLKRAGQFAENGVFKLASQFWPSIRDVLKEINDLETVGEFGVNSGLLKFLEDEKLEVQLLGVDKSSESISHVKEKLGPGSKIKFQEADILDVEKWAAGLDRQKAQLFFSIHFHEFMAFEGLVPGLLGNLKKQFKDCYLLAFEQPRLDPEERNSVAPHLWSYSFSNILIHHLIGNGKILKRSEWKDLFESQGGKVVKHQPTGYLGYEMFLIKV
ncbi:MAG: hypothetical protein U1E10_13185 [Bdellovibrionales bacterium]|nr:hypothetical protein [Bdellovibrionales bacterium]